MALHKKYEGLEDGLTIGAEIVSACTGVPIIGNVAAVVIKNLIKEFSTPTLKLKDVLNKTTVKSLGIPDSKYDSVFEQTRIALKSINSEDYNSSVFRKKVFTNNCFNPVTIANEIIDSLELGENEKSDVLKAVRFVLAVYLLRWTEEPDFPLEAKQQLQSLVIATEIIRTDVDKLRQNQASQEARIEKLEKNDKEPIPAELTVIPKAINNLIGREQIINDIKSRLGNESILCINADGGLGKTAIAKCIINDVRNTIGKRRYKYKFVAWITSSGNLKDDLSQINIPNTSSDQEAKHLKVCRFLQTNPTFLVIDNMDELPDPDEIDILNTIAGKSTLLITTRATTDVFPSYKLLPLDRDTAVTLFYNHFFHDPYISDITHEKIYEEITTEQIKDVYKIVDATGRNALIIELLAKTSYADGLKVPEIWEKIHSGILGVESKTEVQTDHSGKYPESKLAIDEQMRRLYSMLTLSDKQKEILSFISLFPAEHDIFSDVFKWAGFFDQGANDMKYLVDIGWIIREEDYYSIHTIVRDSINLQNQNSGNEVSILNYEELIRNLSHIDNYIPRTMDYNLAQKQSFVPQTVGKLLSKKVIYNTNVGTFLIYLADLNMDQGNYDEALKYYKLGLEIYKKTLGRIHPGTAAAYNSLANLYKNLGKNPEAKKLYKLALKIRKKTLGINHPSTAATYNNLASLYSNQGKSIRALLYFKIALAIDLKTLGKNHPDIAPLYNNIARQYHNQGKFDEAMEFYKLTLKIDETALGKDHPDIAITYNNIAGLYQDQGFYDEAVKYFNMALAIQEKKLGKNHPETAVTYNNIACLFRDYDKYDEAYKYYNMALDAQKDELGEENPNIAMVYNNLGGLYHEQGDYNKALKYYKMALEITEKTLGKYHPDTATSYSNIALLYKDSGEYDKALEYYNITLDIHVRVLGIHKKTAKTFEKLADLHLKMGNYDEAQKCKTRAEKIWKKLRDNKLFNL